jgi:SpoVK/Ycf46/Vps4 family AAA+-type ATPase
VLAALLKAGSSAAVMLCGAPVETALAALQGVLVEAQVGGYVYETMGFGKASYEALLKKASAEGKVVVIADCTLANTGWPYEGLAKLDQARTERVPVVIVLEAELKKVPSELVSSCLTLNLAPKIALAAKQRDHLRELCSGKVSERTLELLARMTGKKTLEVLERMTEQVARTDPEQLEALIDLAAKAEESRRAKGKEAPKEVEWVESGHYHVDLINADMSLDEVLAVMRAGSGKKGARLLMSGESGAGKTEYAKHLARELGFPLRQRRASDLLHWRLGMYEKLIHREFVAAARDGAVLLIDEVESLIQAREMNRSWSAGVSLTNAFLTELDLFPGLFIACTNNPDMLDHALMRRMTLKVTFHPLREHNRVVAYERELEQFGGPLGEAERRRLTALEGLCLGDVGNVARHLELMAAFRGSGSMAAGHIVDLLEKEVRERSPASVGRIGFA